VVVLPSTCHVAAILAYDPAVLARDPVGSVDQTLHQIMKEGETERQRDGGECGLKKFFMHMHHALCSL
jgi:hypothetical protein